MDLASNNLQRLIHHKTQQTKPNQSTTQNLMIGLCLSLEYSVWFAAIMNRLKNNILQD